MVLSDLHNIRPTADLDHGLEVGLLAPSHTHIAREAQGQSGDAAPPNMTH